MADLLSGDWNYPTRIRAGAGRVAELARSCAELGMKAPLLVTDPGLANSGMVVAAVQQCRDAGLRCACFSDIKSNPTAANVGAGAQVFNAGGYDGVIAFGGGSALDAGKAIALVAGQERPLFDFVDEGDNWKRVISERMAPVIAVPTTSGTGSEVGRAAVITDPDAQLKRIVFHPRMMPALVILDPQLTLGLPPQLTAATGMDALSHNLEALCARGYHPMADGIALEGLRLVLENLETACSDGSNLAARTHMQLASSMGATAFQKGLGAMHALAHPLGALYDAHHGLLNAILMPYVLIANAAAIGPQMLRASRYLGLGDAGLEGVLKQVLALRAAIGIPGALSELGIDDSQADRVGQMAVEDAAAGGNPVSFNAGQYSALFRAAVAGAL
jgi:alcohol dehydrogenase class IV